MHTIDQAISWGCQHCEKRAVLWLLEKVTQQTTAFLYTHGQDALTQSAYTTYSHLIQQYCQGIPMAYLLEQAFFMGRPFMVNQHVLIPREDTSCLVNVAVRHLSGCNAPIVLDWGTGSGNIAITLALSHSKARIIATDCSFAALAVAEKNAQVLHAPRIEFFWQNWRCPHSFHVSFECIVSNPPYVSADDPHWVNLQSEPSIALLSQENGLSDISTIVHSAKKYLKKCGWLMLEHGYSQGQAVRNIFRHAHYGSITTYCDMEGRERVCIGQYNH